jgi:hypothetical protein
MTQVVMIMKSPMSLSFQDAKQVEFKPANMMRAIVSSQENIRYNGRSLPLGTWA